MEGVPVAWLSALLWSSDRGPGGKKAGLSLPYKARCWRARRSRRLSSLMAAGLLERSDLFADISARRPMEKEKKERIKKRVTQFFTGGNRGMDKGRKKRTTQVILYRAGPIHDNRCNEERKEMMMMMRGNHEGKRIDRLPRTSVVLLLLVIVAELPFTLCRHPTLCLHHLFYLIGAALVPL